jgi:hypothetical protein
MGTRLFFTPSAARRSLEDIRPAAEKMVLLYGAMQGRAPRVGAGDRPVDPEYFRMARRLTATMDRLREAGVRIEDPRTGTIAFPARRAGRMVLLCWTVGEPNVGYWREIRVGPPGRRPVDEDGPWEAPDDRDRG